jgi:hypothetical protein
MIGRRKVTGIASSTLEQDGMSPILLKQRTKSREPIFAVILQKQQLRYNNVSALFAFATSFFFLLLLLVSFNGVLC